MKTHKGGAFPSDLWTCGTVYTTFELNGALDPNWNPVPHHTVDFLCKDLIASPSRPNPDPLEACSIQAVKQVFDGRRNFLKPCHYDVNSDLFYGRGKLWRGAFSSAYDLAYIAVLAKPRVQRSNWIQLTRSDWTEARRFRQQREPQAQPRYHDGRMVHVDETTLVQNLLRFVCKLDLDEIKCKPAS